MLYLLIVLWLCIETCAWSCPRV